MSRKTRAVDRIIKEQDTVGAQRAERRELEETESRMKTESALTKAQRLVRLAEKEREVQANQPRVARAGKPLKRQR